MLPSRGSGHVAKLSSMLLMRILFLKKFLSEPGIPLFQGSTFIISIFIIFHRVIFLLCY